MEAKKHFKLFKAGKMWCTMAIATLAVATGTAIMAGSASADEAAPAASQTVQAVQTTTNQDSNNRLNLNTNKQGYLDQFLK